MSAAGSSRSAKGSLPKRLDNATQPATAPGTVTESKPRLGGVLASSPYFLRKYSGVQLAGALPDAFRPCSSLPSHRIARASLPRPLLTGSQTVMAAAAAMAASTALPPFHSMRSPACAASGCEVDTALRANTGMRVVGYGLWKPKFFMRSSFQRELLLHDDLFPF